MPTKSIRLSEEEAHELRAYVTLTGEIEAVALKNAAVRGLRAGRLDRGILAYVNGLDSAEAAVIAGLPRARFLDLLMERGITVLDGPSTVREEVAQYAKLVGDERLQRLAEGVE